MKIPPRWVVVVSLAVAATLPGDSLLYAVLPIVWSQLDLELWMVGVLLSANRFVRLITNPVAGWVVERTGVRLPFIVAVFASTATTAAYGLGSGLAVLLLARVCWGICWSFLRLGGFLAVLDAADAASRGYTMGFYSGVARLGTLFAVLVGGLLTDWLGFRTTALAFAGISFVAGLAMLRERPPESLGSSASLDPTPEADDLAESARDRRQRWAVYAAAFIAQLAANSLVVATLGLWLSQQFGEQIEIGWLVLGVASLNGILLAARFSLDVLWAPSAGHLSDRLGRRGFVVCSGAVTGVGLLALSLTTSLAATAVISIAFFLGATALLVALTTTAGDLAPPRLRARVMSWYATWNDLGAAMGPFIAYPLASAVGLAWVYRGGAACLLLAGAVVAWVMLRGQARPSISS